MEGVASQVYHNSKEYLMGYFYVPVLILRSSISIVWLYEEE